ncbi:hypothetical protein [Tissierella sp.]|uniref:hypothetical protein n=1 Tax=Tissierella sp. TaxID=41274 RepID=UPI0030432BF4
MIKMKTKDVKLDGIEIKIRRAKVKEIKSLIKEMTTKVIEVVSFIYDRPMSDNEFIESIPNFIIENIEFFEKYILDFTVDFTQDDLDNLEFLDAIEIVREILSFNGVSEDFIKSFFYNLKKTNQAIEIKNEFIQEIPKV